MLGTYFVVMAVQEEGDSLHMLTQARAYTVLESSLLANFLCNY